jgi:hypothetical protein
MCALTRDGRLAGRPPASMAFWRCLHSGACDIELTNLCEYVCVVLAGDGSGWFLVLNSLGLLSVLLR